MCKIGYYHNKEVILGLKAYLVLKCKLPLAGCEKFEGDMESEYIRSMEVYDFSLGYPQSIQDMELSMNVEVKNAGVNLCERCVKISLYLNYKEETAIASVSQTKHCATIFSSDCSEEAYKASVNYAVTMICNFKTYMELLARKREERVRNIIDVNLWRLTEDSPVLYFTTSQLKATTGLSVDKSDYGLCCTMDIDYVNRSLSKEEMYYLSKLALVKYDIGRGLGTSDVLDIRLPNGEVYILFVEEDGVVTRLDVKTWKVMEE